MPERPDLHVQPDDGTADDMVAAAFASYRSEAAELFTRTASPRLFGDAKRYGRRRVATLGAAVAGSLSLLLGGVAVATTVAYSPDPESNATGGVDSDGAEPGGPPTAGEQPVPTVSASPGDGPATADPANLRNATLTLPAWPGTPAAACPGGTFRFADGVVVSGTSASEPAAPPPTGSAAPSGAPAGDEPPAPQWRVLPGPAPALYADVVTVDGAEGVEGDELLLPVGCGEKPLPGLVAMAGDGTPLAFVFAGDGPSEQLTGVAVADGVISISLTADDTVTERSFRWADGAFTEVTDASQSPTASPSSPSPTTPPDTGDEGTDPGTGTGDGTEGDPAGDGAGAANGETDDTTQTAPA